MHKSALAKVSAVFNNIFTGCTCAPCAVYDVEAYESVGCCEPDNLVVSQS